LLWINGFCPKCPNSNYQKISLNQINNLYVITKGC
jgi:hypothetical protein